MTAAVRAVLQGERDVCAVPASLVGYVIGGGEHLTSDRL